METKTNFSALYEDLLANEKQDDYVFNIGNSSFTLRDLKLLTSIPHVSYKKIARLLNIPQTRLKYLINLYNLTNRDRALEINPKMKIPIGGTKLIEFGDLISLISWFSNEEVANILKIDLHDLSLILRCFDLDDDKIKDVIIREFKQATIERNYLKTTYFTFDGHKKWKLFHRTIVEKHIGRLLKKGETVHHIDCNKINNNISNLFLCSSQDHTLLHKELENIGRLLFNLGYVKFVDGHYVLDISRLDENLLYEYGKTELNKEDILAEV